MFGPMLLVDCIAVTKMKINAVVSREKISKLLQQPKKSFILVKLY